MLASYAWRLDVRLAEGGGGRWVPLRIRTKVRTLARNLAGDGLMITRHPHDPAGLLVFGGSQREIEAMQARLERRFAESGVSATIAIDCWSATENQWNQVRGLPDREERLARHGLDDSEIRFGARAIGLAFAALLAAGGITFYAITPYTFGAYQAATLLLLPLLLIALVWLHRRLPIWLQWTASIVLFPLGAIAYLIAGGAQWWNWGQLTAVPLLMLVFREAANRETPLWHPSRLEPPVGPFGPP